MIFIGLTRPSESAQALIGFSFLFILSMVILNNGLQLESGASITTNSTAQNVQFQYTTWSDSNSHFVGFWLAVISALSFIFTLMSIRKYRAMTPED